MATLTRKLAIIFWAILVMSTLVIPAPGRADSASQDSYRIGALEWAQTADDLVLTIKGDTPPTYTMYELFNPFRVVIDIADGEIDPSVDMSLQTPKGPVSKMKGQILGDKEPSVARIEFFMGEDSSYTVDRLENNIIVTFAHPVVSSVEEQQPQDSAASVPPESQADEIVTETLVPSPAAPVQPEVAKEAVLAEPTAAEAVGQPATPPSDAPAKTKGLKAKKATVLFDIEVEHADTETRVFLKADGVINDYKKVELEKNLKAERPDRMYIDVKNVKLTGPHPPEVVGTALAQVRTGSRSDGFRVVFDSSLDSLFDYQISEQDDGLLVIINEPSAATSVIAGLLTSESPAAGAEEVAPEVVAEPAPQAAAPIIEEDTTEAVIVAEATSIGGTATVATEKDSRPTATASALAFAGYTRERITVDFYKIDLHNVFRLFGEISNLNMVVDQAVGGSLTLALTDVPWDFALDIILNLKDLQKEERYNTIVISPKSKKFEWPEKTLESVEVKVDETYDFKQQEEEGLKISQQQEIPATVVEARNLIHQAQNREKLGNYTAALALYEEAFSKWPENTIIAKRIAALALVRLGQNAKAVHYSKMVLKADPYAYDSALQAAVGLARMKKNQEAAEYFEKSISGSTPSSAAFTSYSAFNEELQQFDHALALLKKHEEIHGDSLDTMISTARIHDKQGHRSLASAEYQTILLSGYKIPADLTRYIKGRAALATP